MTFIKTALFSNLKAPEGMKYIWASDYTYPPDAYEKYDQVDRIRFNLINKIWFPVYPDMLSEDEWSSLRLKGAMYDGVTITFKCLSLFLRHVCIYTDGEEKNYEVNRLISNVSHKLHINMEDGLDIRDHDLKKLISMFNKPSTQEDLLSEISTNAKLKEIGFTV